MIHHPSEYIKVAHARLVRDQSAEAEKLGKLTPAQLELAYQQQWLRLLVPAAYGGAEKPLPGIVKIEEALSWADGSLGWVVTLCSGAGWFGGFISNQIAPEIFTNEKLCLAGSGASTGTATPYKNGYIINGTWKYASGVHHATHITVNCVVQNELANTQNPASETLISSFIIDRKDVKLLPGWKYMGMVATGSDAYSIKDVWVEENRRFKIDPSAAVIQHPLYQYPFYQLAEATLAANLSGMSVHFVDLCHDIFENRQKDKKAISVKNKLVMDEALQNQTASLNEARTAFFNTLSLSWGNAADENLLQKVSATSRQLAKASRQAVDHLYPYCGLMAAAPDTEINRVWRDLHTASQHSMLTF